MLPLLYDGQRLDQPTFHVLYEQLPESFRAELIEGVVHLMHPVNPRHGKPQANLLWFFTSYAASTPGLAVSGEVTVKLGPKNEVQPDGALWIEPDRGGQIRYDGQGYFLGSPELIIEIASSTLAVDLGAKKEVYERSNALEYVVFDEPGWRIRWFHKVDGRFALLPIDPDGLFRSRAFPGLWLDEQAFLDVDHQMVLVGLNQGLGCPEHAEFVARLANFR